MDVRTPRVVVATLLAGLLVAGCASTPSPAEDGRTQAVVEVDAAADAPDLATVWIQPEFGDAELLGSMSSGETAQFRYAPDGFIDGQYHLVLQSTGADPGETMVSDQFTVSRSHVLITWDTGVGTVKVEELPAPEVGEAQGR